MIFWVLFTTIFIKYRGIILILLVLEMIIVFLTFLLYTKRSIILIFCFLVVSVLIATYRLRILIFIIRFFGKDIILI